MIPEDTFVVLSSIGTVEVANKQQTPFKSSNIADSQNRSSVHCPVH